MKNQHENKQDNVSNIRLAFFLNLVFAIVEITGGFWTNSITILSDALHDLGDSFSLGLSWILEGYSRKGRDRRYSFGYRRYSLLAALINSIILIAGSAYILSEAVPRLFRPEQVNEKGMLFFAIGGIIVNGIALLKVRRGKSLNFRVVTLHIFEDVLGWTVILIMSIVMVFKYIPLLDPVLSILFIIYILYRAIVNLKKTFSILLQAVPEGLSVREIEDKLLEIKNVVDVHHIHIWSMDSLNNVLSAHIVVEDNTDKGEVIEIKRRAKKIMESMNIVHSTLEIEYESELCKLRGRECF
ncbi:MAG: cation diffusion facilitator family transporter [Actinomycetota bacterium]|nr:cation diffusion facilitator family transporter [Actinomycetota bacterium]